VPPRVSYGLIDPNLIKQLGFEEIKWQGNSSFFLQSLVHYRRHSSPRLDHVRSLTSLSSTLLYSETRGTSYCKESHNYDNNTFALFPLYL